MLKLHFKHACVSLFILTLSGPLWAGRPTQPSRPPSSSRLPVPYPKPLYTAVCEVASCLLFHCIGGLCPVCVCCLSCLFSSHLFLHALSSYLSLPSSALLMSPDSPACSEPLPLPHTSELPLRSCCSCSFMSALIAHINITVYRHAAVIHVRECHFA